VQDRRASTEYPEAKRLLGALANSRGHRHEENAAKLVQTAMELPVQIGAALLASAEGYTPRATKVLDDAREGLGSINEVALALSENLPAPKQPSSSRRRRRRRKKKVAVEATTTAPSTQDATTEGQPPAPKRRRRRRKPSGDTPVAEASGREQGEADGYQQRADDGPLPLTGHEGPADRADALPEEHGAGKDKNEAEATGRAAEDHT
jgi:hypothetical protein